MSCDISIGTDKIKNPNSYKSNSLLNWNTYNKSGYKIPDICIYKFKIVNRIDTDTETKTNSKNKKNNTVNNINIPFNMMNYLYYIE